MMESELRLIDRCSLSRVYEKKQLQKESHIHTPVLTEFPTHAGTLKPIYPHFFPRNTLMHSISHVPAAMGMGEAKQAYQTMRKLQKQLNRTNENLQLK